MERETQGPAGKDAESPDDSGAARTGEARCRAGRKPEAAALREDSRTRHDGHPGPRYMCPNCRTAHWGGDSRSRVRRRPVARWRELGAARDDWRSCRRRMGSPRVRDAAHRPAWARDRGAGRRDDLQIATIPTPRASPAVFCMTVVHHSTRLKISFGFDAICRSNPGVRRNGRVGLRCSRPAIPTPTLAPTTSLVLTTSLLPTSSPFPLQPAHPLPTARGSPARAIWNQSLAG
jgi:hypothetical protein